jgi:hypothetical protein
VYGSNITRQKQQGADNADCGNHQERGYPAKQFKQEDNQQATTAGTKQIVKVESTEIMVKATEKDRQGNPGTKERQGRYEVETGQGQQQTSRQAAILNPLLKWLVKRLMEKGKDLESEVRLQTKQHENTEKESNTQTKQDRTAGSYECCIIALKPTGA